MGTTTTLMTVDEFLALPEIEGERRELIGGELVTMGCGGRPHEFVKSNINRLIITWLIESGRGRVFIETAYRLDDHHVLVPDLSYESKDPGASGSTGLICDAPELAIEVVSSEPAARLSKKVGLYLAHGGKSVWAVFPEEQTVWIYSAGQAKEFHREQMLEDFTLPGFHAPVSALFEGV